MYCEYKGKIYSLLKYSLQESLVLVPIIILHLHHHHHHHGVDSVACFGSRVVLKVSSYEFENASMKDVKTQLSICKICVYEITLKMIETDSYLM